MFGGNCGYLADFWTEFRTALYEYQTEEDEINSSNVEEHMNETHSTLFDYQYIKVMIESIPPMKLSCISRWL